MASENGCQPRLPPTLRPKGRFAYEYEAWHGGACMHMPCYPSHRYSYMRGHVTSGRQPFNLAIPLDTPQQAAGRIHCKEDKQRPPAYLYTYEADQHSVRGLFLVLPCCASLHWCRPLQGGRAPLCGDGYRPAGGAPCSPGRSVVRSATRATVSSCASGVSGQRSGWANAMSCRTVRSSVARSATTCRWASACACATWRRASVWTWTIWVARAWMAWTTPVLRVCTRGSCGSRKGQLG